MARYADVPDSIKITSEMIEPTFGTLMGRWFAQAEYMKATYGQGSIEHIDALENLWQGMLCLSNLSSLCLDTVHASIAMSNYLGKVDRHIEEQLGFSPTLDAKDAPFRSLA